MILKLREFENNHTVRQTTMNLQFLALMFISEISIFGENQNRHAAGQIMIGESRNEACSVIDSPGECVIRISGWDIFIEVPRLRD